MATLSEKYRSFRVRNQHSYPGLFIALGFTRGLLQIAVVFGVTWYALSLISSVGSDDQKVLVQRSQLTGFADDNRSQVEIPATTATGSTGPVPGAIVESGVYNADWLLKQNAGSYVVQLASSTVKPDLYQKAFTLAETHPVVVFPFRKTRGNQLMYGYAIGMYQSFNEAQNEVNKLPVGAVTEGVWIRPVSEVQKQIAGSRG